MLNSVSPVFVYSCELNVLIPPFRPPPPVNIETACTFSCLLLNPIISSPKKKVEKKKRRLFPKVLWVTFVSSVKCAVTLSH